MNITSAGRRALGAAALLGLTALGAAHAQPAAPPARADGTLTRRMAEGRTAGWSAVIVKLDGALTADRQARLAALGVDVTRRLPIIGSVAARVPTRNLKALAALPFVTHLSLDGGLRKCDDFTVGSSGAAVAWQAPYYDGGQGVTVAVVDSGLRQSHPDLGPTPAALGSLLGTALKGPRVVDSVSFVADANGKSLSADDQCGHGTHVAGIVAGNGADSFGKQYTHTFTGVAPLASLVNVRVLDASGGGTVSGVVSGIQWVIQNQAKDRIKVLNLSLGHPVGESYTTDPLCQAVEAAWRAGIVVVCAAGNAGRMEAVQDQPDNEGWGTAYGSIQSPGNDPYVITVGATKSTDGKRADDRIATYSSRGPSRLDLVCKPDLVAPGNRVVSLDVNNSALDLANGGANQIPLSSYSTVKNKDADKTSDNYYCLSGTSMAAPVVAGAAALLLQKYPSLSPDTVKARLMLAADKPDAWCDASGSYDACTYGAGSLNIPAALTNTFTVVGEYAISPSLSIDPSGSVTVNDDHALWGRSTVDASHALWGRSALWGSSGLTDLSALWGSHALWGRSTLASSHVLWGSSVWGDHAMWGSSYDGVDLSSVVFTGE